MNNVFKNIAVVLGGASSEREVSLRTGEAIAKALESTGRQVLRFDPKLQPLAELLTAKVDAVFIALHGKGGEDGCIQGLLETAKIPYTGSGVLSSALCYDKLRTKVFLSHYGVKTPDYLVYHKGEETSTWAKDHSVHFPVIVKPSHEGSSVGMTIVKEVAGLPAALEKAVPYCNEVLVESFIAGCEVTCGVLGSEALPLIEVAPKSGFYDYESKYTPGKTEYILPARITSATAERIAKESVSIMNWLGCRGAARLDYMIDVSGEPYFLEINTIPGMTQTSLLPKAAAAAGISFEQLCERILNSAELDN